MMVPNVPGWPRGWIQTCPLGGSKPAQMVDPNHLGIQIQLHHRRLHHRCDCLRLCGCRCRLARRCRAFLAAQAVVAVDGTRPCLQADSGWHTPVDTNDFGNLRSSGGLSASLGSQVATSSSRYGRRCSGGGAKVWAAVPVAKRKSATVAQAPSPWQPPYSLLSPRGAPSQLPAPSHDSSRGRASATAPETRPWSRSETFTPPPPLGPLFAGCRAKLQCRADRAEFCSFAETTDQTCQNERPPT